MSRSRADSAQPINMAPPSGFIEQAVARALARIAAEEALRPLPMRSAASNDLDSGAPRRRRDSGTVPAIDVGDALAK